MKEKNDSKFIGKLKKITEIDKKNKYNNVIKSVSKVIAVGGLIGAVGATGLNIANATSVSSGLMSNFTGIGLLATSMTGVIGCKYVMLKEIVEDTSMSLVNAEIGFECDGERLKNYSMFLDDPDKIIAQFDEKKRVVSNDMYTKEQYDVEKLNVNENEETLEQ